MSSIPPASRIQRKSFSDWKVISGGITAAADFLAAGVAAGIKEHGLDLAIVYSSKPSIASAVFTCNQVQAPPVQVSREYLRRSKGRIRAVLLNSGCANACTGSRGMRHAILSTRNLAARLGLKPHEVVVASTGVIGSFLPIGKVLRGLDAAVSSLSSQGGRSAVQAIMTTDTKEKTSAVQCRIGGKTVHIGGMVKGAGMIHPQMATMLSVITTDAGISRSLLDRVFRRVVDQTFNCLTVDGDTSTNDMVILLANGSSGFSVDLTSAQHFERGLRWVCEELAKSVARDGEGATKFVEIEVSGAPSYAKARQVAKTIAHSPLVKTALFGEELNWGRIICAAGYSGVRFDPNKATLRLGGIPVYRNGMGVAFADNRAEKALKLPDIQIHLDLRQGNASARVWTCDLSHGYVDINGSYIT